MPRSQIPGDTDTFSRKATPRCSRKKAALTESCNASRVKRPAWWRNAIKGLVIGEISVCVSCLISGMWATLCERRPRVRPPDEDGMRLREDQGERESASGRGQETSDERVLIVDQ